ncbi:MAG: hypothetical protein RIR26_2177 [Pseudomonadota bacterium]
MKDLVREFLWVLLSTLCLGWLPWWQVILVSAATAPFLLRLTERGFKRRLIFLFASCLVLFFSFHASRSLVANAVSKLFRLPHFSLLAVLSAGCFSLAIALAAESVLWVKYTLRKVGQKIPFPSTKKLRFR